MGLLLAITLSHFVVLSTRTRRTEGLHTSSTPGPPPRGARGHVPRPRRKALPAGRPSPCIAGLGSGRACIRRFRPRPERSPPLLQSPGHTDATPQFHRLRTPAGRGLDRGFQAFVVSAASMYGRPPIRGFDVWLGGPSAASLYGIQCNERSDRSHLDITNARIQRAVGTHEATNRPGATAPRTARPHSRTPLTQVGSAVRSPRAFCVERPLANGFRPTEASWRATVHPVGALCVKKLLPSALTVRTYH